MSCPAGSLKCEMSTPGVEPGLSRPQHDVLTTRRCGLMQVVPTQTLRACQMRPSRESSPSLAVRQSAQILNCQKQSGPLGIEPRNPGTQHGNHTIGPDKPCCGPHCGILRLCSVWLLSLQFPQHPPHVMPSWKPKMRNVHTRSRTWVVAATTRRPNH